MMRNIIYVASIALMASGMVVAQSSGSQGTMDSQIGSSTASAPQTPANPKTEAPSAMGAPTTPNSGTAASTGETPATGAPSQKQGSSDDNGIHAGMNSTSTPPADNPSDASAKSGDPNSANVPSYAKPITSSGNSKSSTTPSQQGSDSGTASPK